MNNSFGLSVKNGMPVAPLGGMGKKFDEIPANATPTQKVELGKLKKLSSEYESFFMKEVISSMRQTVQKGGNLDGGNAEEIFTSMMDDQLAGSMSKQGNSGIAQELYNRLSKTYLAVSQGKNGIGK
jgi:Rod binding domain-containing protein